MNRVLIYNAPDGEQFAWDASRPQLRDAAYLSLFSLVDRSVTNLVRLAGDQLRDMARRGNPDFARAFLELHRGSIPGSFNEIPVLPAEVPRERPTRKVECPEALTLDAPALTPRYEERAPGVHVLLEGPGPVFDTRDRPIYHVDDMEKKR